MSQAFPSELTWPVAIPRRARSEARDEVAMSILQRVADGEPRAVEECLDRYGGLVWSMARKLTRSDADAQDAVQDVFVALWQHAGRFDEAKSSEPAFIAMIARRRLIDRLRQQTRRLDTESLPDDGVLDASPGARPESNVLGSAAVEALGLLRPEQKKVIELSVVEGFTHSEIAEKTGLPLGTVKTHARRGLIRLRELMSEGAEPALEGA